METFGQAFDRFVKAGISAEKWESRAHFGDMHGLSGGFMSDIVAGKRFPTIETFTKVLDSAGVHGQERVGLLASLSRHKVLENAELLPLFTAMEAELGTMRAAGRDLVALIEKQGVKVPEGLRQAFRLTQ